MPRAVTQAVFKFAGFFFFAALLFLLSDYQKRLEQILRSPLASLLSSSNNKRWHSFFSYAGAEKFFTWFCLRPREGKREEEKKSWRTLFCKSFWAKKKRRGREGGREGL